jgi:hypothetical protein
MKKAFMRWFNRWLGIPEHVCKWRPAATSRGPAKMCNVCCKVIQLSHEEFYAQFGRIVHWL